MDISAGATASDSSERSLPPFEALVERYGRSLLRFLGDLTHAEIGEVMGISEQAARRNVHDGLNQLRQRIDA